MWTDYLAAWPSGRYAGRALWELASLADAEGRPAEAEAFRRRVVEQAPAGPEAIPELASVGKRMIDSGELEAAAAWFQARSEGRWPPGHGHGYGKVPQRGLLGSHRPRKDPPFSGIIFSVVSGGTP